MRSFLVNMMMSNTFLASAIRILQRCYYSAVQIYLNQNIHVIHISPICVFAYAYTYVQYAYTVYAFMPHYYVWATLLFLSFLRGEKLNYNSCTSLLLRKSQNLLFLAPEVQWALKVYRVCSIHVFFKCFEPCPYLVCHVTTIENV